MSRKKTGVTWALFQEQFVALHKVGLPARLPGSGSSLWPGAHASDFTIDRAAHCRQSLLETARAALLRALFFRS